MKLNITSLKNSTEFLNLDIFLNGDCHDTTDLRYFLKSWLCNRYALVILFLLPFKARSEDFVVHTFEQFQSYK